MINDLAIVVITHNRPYSLKRLLNSLYHAHYSNTNITLYIAIDYSIYQNESVEIAKDFNWKNGAKSIIKQNINLGLKNHVIACTDLVKNHDAIIVLEDDLFVAPYFYTYALKTYNFYRSDSKIAGISLFTYETDEIKFYPFRPLKDDSDVHFIQVPSSWGQVWGKTQWNNFKNWYHLNSETALENLPDYAKDWGTHSWKKYTMNYLIQEDLYFVFPNSSYTTNFEEPGVNSSRTGFFLSSLELNDRAITLQKFDNSKSVYDAHFEITPHSIISWNKHLNKYNFDVDLKRCKPLSSYSKDYVLTYNKEESNKVSFSNLLYPIEQNIALGLKGREIGLHKKEHLNNITDVELECSYRKADTLFKKNRDYRYVIIILIERFNTADLKKSINALGSQDYPFIDIHLACHTNDYAPVLAFAKAEKESIKVHVSNTNNNKELLLESLISIRNNNNADYYTWFTSGTEMYKDGINRLQLLFNKYPFIECVKGLPYSIKDINISNLNSSPYRWKKNDINSLRESDNINLSQGLFYHREIIQSTDNSNLFELLFPMEKTIYLALINLIDQKEFYKSSIKLWSPFVALEVFYKLDIPFLRSVYREIKKVPPVYRYDHQHNNFYQENY
jgi:hypothetical protein